MVFKGDTNIGYLKENSVRRMNGRMMTATSAACTARNGATARAVGRTIHQIDEVIEQINNQPTRRLIVSAWNVGELDQMALALPRVFSILRARRRMSCQLYQRSADLFLSAIQHRQLRVAHHDECAGDRPEAR